MTKLTAEAYFKDKYGKIMRIGNYIKNIKTDEILQIDSMYGFKKIFPIDHSNRFYGFADEIKENNISIENEKIKEFELLENYKPLTLK